MFSDIFLQQIVLGIAVFAAFYIMYYVLDGALLGPEHTYWNGFRRNVLPLLDETARDVGLFTINNAYDTEYVCTVKADLEFIERYLHGLGYDRNVLAGLKQREGDDDTQQFEATSWAHRSSQHPIIPDPLAFWQTHVFLFENTDGTFDVYSHYEYSSMNPVVAYQHINGIDQDHERGVKNVLRQFGQNPDSLIEIVETAKKWDELDANGERVTGVPAVE